MERQAKDGTVYQQVGQDEWTPVTRTAKDGTVYKKMGEDAWTPLESKAEKPKESRKLEAVLEGFGEGATLGYLNNLQALADKPVTAIGNLLTGNDVEADDYVTARDSYNKRQIDLANRNPKSFMAGQFAGAAASSIPVAKAAQGATALGRAIGAAKAGAAYGALQNTSEKDGELGDLNVSDRIESAAFGAAMGVASSLGGDAIAKGAKTVGKTFNNARKLTGEQLNDIAESMAFKSTGAKLKDFRAAGENTNEIGRYLLDKGIINVGDSVDDIAKKSKAVMDAAGKELDRVYGLADSAMKNSMSKTGFDPIRDKQRIMDAAKKELGDTYGAENALKNLSNYLDEVTKNHVDTLYQPGGQYPPNYQPMSPRRGNDIKGALDDRIKYDRNPVMPDPAQEKAMYGARTEINKIVQDSVDQLGGSKEARALRAANKDYSVGARVNSIVEDQIKRSRANKMFGLTDTIAGGASATYGAVTGDWETAIAAMAAKKGFEKYGTTGIARLADAASRKLLSQPQMSRLAQVNPEAFKATVFGLVERMGERQSSMPLPRSAENEKPTKGPQKWMNDGIDLITESDNSIDRRILEKLKETKNGQKILIEASSAKNPKAMDRILKQIRTSYMNGGE